jgi:hypothetical protein
MAITGKYLYCFIREKEKFTIGSSSVADHITPVYTIPQNGIAAVVSDAELTDYEPTRKNVLAHQRVINLVTSKYTIIPVAFGTVASSRSDLEHLMSRHYEEFIKVFEYFKDKFELGLRVTWEKSFFNQDVEDDEIRELKQKITGKNEDEVLVDKIQLGRLVEAAILEKKELYTHKIFEPLKAAATDSKLKDGIPIKTVFSAYFLVEKAKSDEFDKLVETVCKPYEGKLAFSYTGPWPPYNFVDLSINLHEGDD